MKTLISIFICLALQTSSVSGPSPPQTAIVTSKAIWGPAMGVVQEIRQQCGQLSGAQFGECFFSMMQKDGAAPEALSFARMTGSFGYMRDFRETGPVDVAFTHFPFRANENQGAYLVNGAAAMIDIDDQTLLAREELNKNLTYSRLARLFPEIALWPGDRNGTSYLNVKKLPVGGVRFTAGYTLRKACHACEVVGNAHFAFDFDRSGRFLGTKLMGVSSPRAGRSAH